MYLHDVNLYDFYTGRSFDAYKWLGAHVVENGVLFRTYAPSAKGVVLVWNGQSIPMNAMNNGHFYEIFAGDAKEGDEYEYRIYGQDGSCVEHSDPYGFGMELRPAHRSIVRNLSGYKFSDGKWMKSRSDMKNKPLNIYELHLGSWRKKDETQTGWYNYVELGEILIPYLKESGYNYVEFMPLSEHPCDESWGYQNTGFFAPTSRYGTMDDLKKLIDMLHKNNIGAILDFVPVHFAVDYYALAKYDGTYLYEYPHGDVGVSEWGSCNFMHSRGEVRSFLQSSANYWLKEYHFDGLRMDAISRIIYWQGDERRGVNGNAVDFIKGMNYELKAQNPGCILAAEDSTNFPMVTRRVEEGGLGFDYKWDMGWMHDTLEYFQAYPSQRTDRYHKLTFSMMYFRNENYMLPLSHDEVVHGKATILQKMNGDYDGKFPQARAMYLYMMVHPGKKLNFMGNEIGQFREWDEKREQDWNLREYPIHEAFYKYMKDLNNIYLKHTALSEWDYMDEGFKWLDCHQEWKCMYSILRTSSKEELVAIFNFSDREQEFYEEKISNANKAKLLINSDWDCYGGGTKKSAKIPDKLQPFSGILVKVEF